MTAAQLQDRHGITPGLAEETEPDLFDLSYWLALNRPEVYEAIRYLHAESLYSGALEVWKIAGCPPLKGD